MREGRYLAVVGILQFYDQDASSPYLSVEDALKLDTVRKALREGNVDEAARFAKVYELTPVAR